MKINGVEMFISEKTPWKVLPKMKSITIMAQETKKARDEGKDITHAKLIDYDDVKTYLEKNRKKLFSGSPKFAVRILTEVGWRGGKTFGPNEPILWVDMENYANKNDDYQEIYAIEIIYHP